MGEKNKKKCDWFCLYCSGKGVKDQLRELGYLYTTKIGDCVDCPKCNITQKVEK